MKKKLFAYATMCSLFFLFFYSTSYAVLFGSEPEEEVVYPDTSIVVYGRQRCSVTQKYISALKENSIETIFVDIDSRSGNKEFTNRMTESGISGSINLPVVYFDGQVQVRPDLATFISSTKETLARFAKNPSLLPSNKPIASTIDSYRGALAELSVAGIHLGDSPKMALDGLNKFDGGYKILGGGYKTIKKYMGSKYHEYPKLDSKLDEFVQEPGVLFSCTAEKKDGSSFDLVNIYFHPASDQGKDMEKVIAVFRWKTYISDLPKTQSMINGILSKVKSDHVFSTDEYHYGVDHSEKNNTKLLVWQFDKDGAIIPRSKLKNQPRKVGYMIWRENGNFGVDSMMPNRISSENPVNYQALICMDRNELLAVGFSELLIDEQQFISALSSGKRIIKRMTTRNQKSANEKEAATSNRQEKF